jgi:hypothetical protein
MMRYNFIVNYKSFLLQFYYNFFFDMFIQVGDGDAN